MTYDLLIIGGGINGCAIAREAALGGLKVLLVEKDDLAGHTSSASTKLIHGGLRYLEYYEFGLVREALRERERLLRAAPHLIEPMTFVLPMQHGGRPRWVIRAGLWLYDLLAGKSSLPRSRSLKAKDSVYIRQLKWPMKGFVYSDAWVDDARLTLHNAIDAAETGAEIAPRTELTAAIRHGDHWQAMLSDGRSVTARGLVNATGPWVAGTLDRIGVRTKNRVRLVKGSHIVVPRLYNGAQAYILQQPDGRIVFAINYLGYYTMVGTTDIPVDSPDDARIERDEVDYLCAAVNDYFSRHVGPDEVTSHWSGVRPLYDDGESDASAVTREYKLECDVDAAPVLSVFGGKITTARALAEDALAKIGPPLGIDPRPMTRNRPFPGGAIPDFDRFLDSVRERWPFLGDSRSLRMARAYGARLTEMLDGIDSEAAMGRHFGSGLTELEARWMQRREWAVTVEDALERRSKLGLLMSDEERAGFADWWMQSTEEAVA
ncbi:glycerol-3-phosphate dehydrogenase [Stakelama saccharophila]|uniref:Glycerol-3-phosphate dehydrogenase n=1 Tax=Stakelama saccharophila TaxID=3075605 RepID=A0ABZ0B7S4_9SPHN|nr:glycerol-3-phosphate dehydrogenase [Stakelama sp. W311]WNO53313.1 glycerol-3-phosphate dehydrogenase [Stakelama sp. W311]